MAIEALNIVQLLERAASSNAGISTYAPGNALSRYDRTTYHDFLQKARIRAETVRHIKGISKDSVVLLHFDKHSDHFDWFWAVTIAGFIPAISTPFVNDLDQRKKHLIHLFNMLDDPIILTTAALTSEFLDLEQLRIRKTDSLVETKEQINGHVDGTANGWISSYPTGVTNGDLDQRKDIAVLMLTSGSTGNAKAVCLSHRQIIESVQGKSRHFGLSSNDKFLNWIGMDHVANLVEMHLHATYLCAEQVHVQASDLLVEPLAFLRLIDKHRISCAFSPNFFMALLKRALSGPNTRATDISFDLSSLRVLMCGGEANVVSNLVELHEFFLQFGVAHEVFRPGFGMTETCAGSTYGSDCPSYDVKMDLEYSSVGTCIPGMKMRITKDEGPQKSVNREAEVGEIGHLQVSGPIVTKGYYNNPAATEDAFTLDGWFITGDKGFIDAHGKLNLTGRSKETIIVNGVNFLPHELETAIEESSIPGATPSYTVVFPYRPKASQTEELCIVYLPTYDLDDARMRVETSEAISRVSMLFASIRPYRIIPLTKALLPKSTLGKLSRAKIRTAFENGAFRAMEEANDKAIKSYRVSENEMPSTETEKKIAAVLCEMFDLSPDVAWIGSSLFDFGITSIDLIAFKMRVEKKLALGYDIPVLMMMKNPTIKGMAEALEILAQGPRPYTPVVMLQTKGTKTPLWFVHPGNGEVLAFIGLTKYFADRPLYALRARGLEKGEECFHSLAEATETYYKYMKETQPVGPYAILGWSQGGFLAYDVAKRLEAQGDQVVLCGNLDMPPDLRSFRHLSDMDIIVEASYLNNLISKEHAREHTDIINRLTYDEALRFILDLVPLTRREELGLDLPKWTRWMKVMYSLYLQTREHAASGTVNSLDVFYAAESGFLRQDLWVEDVKRWGACSRLPVALHECPGAHHTMLSGDNLVGFQRTLKKVLKEKNI